MFRVLKVSRSSYYKWFSCGSSNRALENRLFTDLIRSIFDKSQRTYGSPRITAELNRQGYHISKRRVAKLMRLNGLRSKIIRKYLATTNSNNRYPICRNYLNRDFIPSDLSQAWVSDITYIQTKQGWLYLTTVIDFYDRQVIGWAFSTTLYTNETIIPAWKMAFSKREIEKPILFHSDRGIQYASKEFRKHIKSNKLITQSISRTA